MRRLPTVAAAALVLLAVAALAGVGRPEPARGDTVPYGTVTTTGHGVVAAVPNEASITAGVHTEAASAAAALAENAKLMDAVVAAMKDTGGTELQTQQVSLSPQTDAQGSVRAYAADDTVSAKTTIAAAGSLIDAAVNAGANTVSGPTLDLSSRDALYLDALGKAVADARAKAEALAKAGGFGIGQVSSVTESSASPPVPLFQGAVAKSAATPVEPGTQDVTADVTVSFVIR